MVGLRDAELAGAREQLCLYGLAEGDPESVEVTNDELDKDRAQQEHEELASARRPE